MQVAGEGGGTPSAQIEAEVHSTNHKAARQMPSCGYSHDALSLGQQGLTLPEGKQEAGEGCSWANYLS